MLDGERLYLIEVGFTALFAISVSFLVEGRSRVGPQPRIVLLPLRRRGSADGSEAQGAVERGTRSVSASFPGRKEERDRDRSSEGEAIVQASASVYATFSSFTIANLYPEPLHLVEASYPWERLNTA